MAEKDKLSKEVEEQIQSLASEVYIQIEERLTQLISTVTPKELAKKINVEQEPAYLALQSDYQASQDELIEKTKNLSEQIHHLEQNTSTLKSQLEDEQNKQANSEATLKAKDEDSATKLAQLEQENIDVKQQLVDEIDKQEGSELNYQVELTQNNINFTETIERLEHENTQLKSTVKKEQEKLSREQQSLKIELSDKTANSSQTIEKLEQALSDQKEHLHQEQTQVDEQNQQLESQIESNKKELLEQQQTIATLKESLAILVAQEQRLKAELSEKEENSNQTIEALKQELSVQKEQLNQEQTQARVHNLQLQSQIESNETKLLEQQQEIVALNEDVVTRAAQEQNLTERLSAVEQQRNHSDNKFQKEEENWKKTEELQASRLAEQKNQIQELTKQLNVSVSDLERTQAQHQQQTDSLTQESEQRVYQLTEQLQQSQIANEKQQQVVIDQQTQLFDLNEIIKKKTTEEQDSKKEIEQLKNEQSQIKQQQLADKKTNDLYQKQQQQAQEISQQKMHQLEIKNQELTNSLITEKADIQLYQKEVSTLKSETTLAQEGYENILNRFNTNREKQEKDNDQVRETIKYLRDENNDMITQNNIQKENYIEQINELDHKLTEYRLKFEYAQKQLIQNNER